LKTGRQSRIQSKSKYQKSEIQVLDEEHRDDINKRIEHLAVSPLYQKIIFDPFRNVYYRFYLNGQPLQNDDGTFNVYGNKELIVMVLDRSFSTISELNLGEGYLWFYSFVTPRGLYILKDERATNSMKSVLNGQKFLFDIINIAS